VNVSPGIGSAGSSWIKGR